LIIQEGDPSQRTYRRAASGAPEHIHDAAALVGAAQVPKAEPDNVSYEGYCTEVERMTRAVLVQEGLIGNGTR
jgi:hypothetical protein